MPNFSIGKKDLAAGSARSLVASAEHHRHRRPVDVGVEQANLITEPVERSRQIRRDGRFADAALATGDRHDEARAIDPHLAGLFAQLGFDLSHLELDLGHAEFMGERLMNPGGKIAQNFLAIARATQRDRIAAVGRWRDFLDQPERHDVGLIAGVTYFSERGRDLFERYFPCHWRNYFRWESRAIADPVNRAPEPRKIAVKTTNDLCSPL